MTESHLADLPVEERPLVTFALFAYNQERFIREAVEGALAQTYTPLQIILSDDCSTDRTFEIMEEMVEGYSGPHEVLLNKNERNLGIGAHVNKLTKLASGELIIGAAGDDYSLPERAQKTTVAWMSCPGVFSIHGRVQKIDENGSAQGSMDNTYLESFSDPRLAVEQMAWVTGSSHAWAKDVFRYFGDIGNDVVNEDMVIPFRSILLGKIVYLRESLVKYRVGVGISSGRIEDRASRVNEIPEKQAKRSLAVLKQYRRDSRAFNGFEQVQNKFNPAELEMLLARKIAFERIKLRFAQRRGCLKLLIYGFKRGVSVGPLLKIYLKHRTPQRVMLLNYRLRGL